MTLLTSSRFRGPPFIYFLNRWVVWGGRSPPQSCQLSSQKRRFFYKALARFWVLGCGRRSLHPEDKVS